MLRTKVKSYITNELFVQYLHMHSRWPSKMLTAHSNIYVYVWGEGEHYVLLFMHFKPVTDLFCDCVLQLQNCFLFSVIFYPFQNPFALCMRCIQNKSAFKKKFYVLLLIQSYSRMSNSKICTHQLQIPQGFVLQKIQLSAIKPQSKISFF